MRKGTSRVIPILSAAAASLACMADAGANGMGLPTDPAFNVVKPSTTGVPGEEVRVMKLDPEGNLWIFGRWPFWFECGLAMLSAAELEYTGLPGGGFDTGKWRVWSNVHHPIPSVFASDMEFDANGVLWLASDGGLTRFDRFAPEGEQWFTYNTANSPLILDAVRSLDFDSQGHLWLTNVSAQFTSGALFEVDLETDTWTSYEVGDELPWFLPWQDINAVMVDSQDHVWLTHSTLSGLAEFDGDKWVLHDGATGALGGMLEDTEGNIWITSGGNGLWKWNGASFQNWPILGGTFTITGLGLGIDGTVYVSCWYGPIMKMIDDSPVFFVDAQGLPRSVIQRPNGDIFINNYGSTLALGRVRHYTADGQLLRRMNTYNSGLPDYFIDNIQKDHSGNMWFACGEGGLSPMLGSDGSPDAPTRWRNWGNHNDLAEPYPWAGNEPMYSMHEDDQGFIWMGGNGIGKWDPRTGTFVDFWNWETSSLGVDSFIRIIQDGNGEMWAFSDYTGGYHLNPATNDWEQQLFGAAFTTANYVNDVTRDLDGNLWVATEVSLHFYDGSDWFAIGPFHGSPVEWPTTVKADPDGGVWIGADNGLTHYEDGQWVIYDMNNAPLPANHVHGLDVRDDGLVAMTVADFSQPVPWPNGVVLFDGTNWQVYSYGDYPLPHYQLGDVEFDADGDVWVSTVSEGVVEIVLHDETLGDLNGDGVVDGIDLALLLGSWGACPPDAACAADLNGDRAVNGFDLAILLGNWR